MADLRIFAIINPSDALSMRAPSIEVAAATVLLLGEGQLGAESWSDQFECTPVVFGWQPWLQAHGMDPLNLWFDAHNDEIVAALNSVLLGSPEERDAIEKALADLPAEARQGFLKRRNDRRRSSLMDWEGRAHAIGRMLRDRHAGKVGADA